MPYDLGDTVRLTAECRDAGGTLTDADTAVVTLTLPDGTTTAPAVTNPPAETGIYSVDYVPDVPGRHGVRWAFTTPDAAFTDVFHVAAEEPALIVSLAAAKRHLNLTGTGEDEEVREWLESITEGVEHLAGVCVRRIVTERHDVPRHGVHTLALHRTPVLELTSLVPILDDGTVYDVAELDVDGASGIVQRTDGGRLCGPLRATYAAGRERVPSSLRNAGKIILQHVWRTQRGASRGPVLGGSEDFSVTEPVPGFGYAIPNRALQLLEPYRLPPGVA